MCGIAGLLGPPARDGEGRVRRMLDVLRHRGPDDEGVWEGEGACLGHRRLSIIDISAAGHQPMVSACGRYVISLNGEIYNFRALRDEVAAAAPIAWRGHSDTEVLVEAIACFGVQGALERAAGMFAFALWDRQERTAWLARDRFGEKPLYWATYHGGLAFASELTALETLPGACGDLDPAALSLFFRYGYTPAPYSIYRAVHKLEPGCLLTWKEGEAASIAPFWNLGDLVEAGQADRLTDPEQAVDELDRLLRKAIESQMVSDVPLGAFLSGGIDSSLVVAIMQAVSPRPVRTFTLGFDSPEFNEAEHALAVARHLRTDHTEHYVTAADAQAIVPSLGAIYDEPFADASQIPTWLISRIAREQVTVCLTGDGGDEMFGGYVRYPGVPRLWNAIKDLPGRGLAASALESLPLGFIDGAMGFLGPLARQYTSRGALGPNVRRAAGWLRAKSRDELYEMTMSAWSDPEALLLDRGARSACWRPPAPRFEDDLEAMMWRDGVDYLPGDILCKVDRASMAHGLETRVPLLDPAIAAFAWRAPKAMKIRDGQAKWLLRRVLDRYAPSALIDRPKMGFSVPLHAWLTGDLRNWAMGLIDPAIIRRQGVLNPKTVDAMWRGFVAGDSGLSHRVWTVLMFQAWQAQRGR